MSLLTPLALLGLLTVPAILLLHLLLNRRERLDIPSLRIWRGLEQKRQGSRPRHIPFSLMLILQLLIAIALTLGLARPALSFLLARPRQVIFILDVTTSMTAEDASATAVEGPARRFDAARKFIQAQLQAMRDQDTFAVVSLEPQPQILLSGDGPQKAQALLALDSFAPGATGVDLAAALTLANGLVDDSANRRPEIIVLTDGAFNVPSEPLPPMLAPVTWQMIPGLNAGGSNQALLNLSSRLLPDGRHRLFARIVNYGDTPVERTLQISVDQRLFDEVTVALAPQEEADRVWTLPERAETVTAEIVEPDLLPLDNRAELLLTGPARYRVLLLSNTPRPINDPGADPRDTVLARALRAQAGVELTVDDPAAFRQELTEFDLIVFEGLSADLTTWPRGNLLVVNPPLGHPLLMAEHFARNLRPATPEPDGSALLAGVDLSGVYFNRVPELTLPEWAEVDLRGIPLTASQTRSTIGGAAGAGHPLIFQGTTGPSRLVVWAFDLAASNLPARLALPILTANTISSLLSPSPPQVVPVGRPVPIDGSFIIELPSGRRLSAFASPPTAETGQAGQFSRTRQPGLYRIYNERNNQVAGFAVHAGAALESNLSEPFSPNDLIISYLPDSALNDTETEYREFWPWLAGLALVVIVFEGWLAWRK